MRFVRHKVLLVFLIFPLLLLLPAPEEDGEHDEGNKSYASDYTSCDSSSIAFGTGARARSFPCT